MRNFLTTTATLAAMTAAAAHAGLIDDNFEFNSSLDYTLVDDGTPDGTATWAFDYIAVGIPLAPNSTAGQRGGLRMTANDTAMSTDALTAFHNTMVSGANYVLQVDVYMGVTGTSGTTEHAHIGVGGDGVTFNQLFTPISGTGHFLAFDGDGGSASDYRHFTPSVTAVPSGDPSYLNSTNTTDSTGDTYQQIFPNTNGVPTNLWTTLTITVGSGFVEYALDGTPIIRTAAEDTDGFISLGYADLFSSVASPFQSQFVIYDNLLVVPEPASLCLLALGAVAALRRQ